MNVLLVEDDLDLCDALSDVLASRGLKPVCCYTGLDGLHIASHRKFDAVILNLTQPGADAVEVLRRLCVDEVKAPALTAPQGSDADELASCGSAVAHGRLSTPFNAKALGTETFVRRNQCDEVLRCGDLWFDSEASIFYSGTRLVDVSPRESSLLKALMHARGKAVAKEVLRDAVFGADAMESVDAIEVLVHRLRKRLSSASVDLVTLRGLGYVLMDQLSMGQECGV